MTNRFTAKLLQLDLTHIDTDMNDVADILFGPSRYNSLVLDFVVATSGKDSYPFIRDDDRVLFTAFLATMSDADIDELFINWYN